IDRCENPNNPSYKRYGARGISVCRAWRTSFLAFLADMGRKPSPRHSVERDDGDGNYEPGNCRWATPKEQARNRRDNVVLAHKGRVACVGEWAEITGLPSHVIRNRLRDGWETTRILTTPKEARRPRGRRETGASAAEHRPPKRGNQARESDGGTRPATSGAGSDHSDHNQSQASEPRPPWEQEDQTEDRKEKK